MAEEFVVFSDAHRDVSRACAVADAAETNTAVLGRHRGLAGSSARVSSTVSAPTSVQRGRCLCEHIYIVSVPISPVFIICTDFGAVLAELKNEDIQLKITIKRQLSVTVHGSYPSESASMIHLFIFVHFGDSPKLGLQAFHLLSLCICHRKIKHKPLLSAAVWTNLTRLCEICQSTIACQLFRGACVRHKVP